MLCVVVTAAEEEVL